jgi:HlyD family secretion protein
MKPENNSPQGQDISQDMSQDIVVTAETVDSHKFGNWKDALRSRRGSKVLWFAGLTLAAVIPFQVGWQAVIFWRNPQPASHGNVTSSLIPQGDRIPVKTVRARTAAALDLVTGNGSVSAARMIYLNFKVAGIVKFLLEQDGRELRVGDTVSQGTLLAKLNEDQPSTDLAQAEVTRSEAAKILEGVTAKFQQSQANLDRAEGALAQAKSQLARAESDRQLAKQDLERYAASKTNTATSTVDSEYTTKRNQSEKAEGNVEIAKSDVSGAEITVKEAREKLEAARADMEAAQANAKEAISSYDAANTNLQGTTLTAPIDGMIAYLNIRRGNYWAPPTFGDPSSEASAAIAIADPDQVEVTVELSTLNAAKIQVKQPVYIFLDQALSSTAIRNLADESVVSLANAEGEVIDLGSISTLSPTSDSKQKIKIRITTGAKKLRIGANVSAWIAIASNLKGVVLPSNAIAYRNQQPFVYVVTKNGVVEQRAVKLGIKGLANQEIASGLSAGELVITDVKDDLANGTPVEVTDISDIGSFIKQTIPSQN